MKILTAAEMRSVDRLTSEQYGVPSLLLMENASVQLAEAIEKKFGALAGKRIVIICGKGNNGGDGAAFARQAWMRGGRADVILLSKIENTSGDARINFEIVKRLGSGEERLGFSETTDSTAWHEVRANLDKYDLIIDGILGTGVDRPAEGLYGEVIQDLVAFAEKHRESAKIISIDIPSGLPTDNGEFIGPAVRAQLTVTLTAPKPANVLPPACYQGGELVVAPIGSPDELIQSAGSTLNLVEQRQVADWLRRTRRRPMSHKGTYGFALIVAGSKGKPGAACLAAQAALRAGAGLVTVGTVPSCQSVIVSHVAEAMTESLAQTPDGSIAESALERALELLGERDLLAIGPGITTHESTRRFVYELIRRRHAPAIIDADGLNCLAPWPDELSGEEHPLILTPHPGEMARLIGSTNADVLGRRVEVARDFAVKHSVVLVLKGNRTLIASPDGQVYINPTGNAGLATAGSGDVLTGMLAGLLAQDKTSPVESAIAAVYLHGLAADLAAAKIGMRAMIASDVTANLSEAINLLEEAL
jgi:NAD(P)H-hydrate epimerase